MAVATFEELCLAAQTLDQWMCQCDAERKGGKGATYHTTMHDPDTMQVNATKQKLAEVKRTLPPTMLG